jgi:lysophospholipase L1-like esterase
MKIAFYGDSLTEGLLGVSYLDQLRHRLPGHSTINYGKGDDTVLSLYQRIVRWHLNKPYDMAFVWVGTNDVPVKPSRIVALLKLMRGKPWTSSPEAFRVCYLDLLDLLSEKTPTLFTVSPLLVGEDVDSPRNQYLGQLAAIIEEVSADYPGVTYIDLRQKFIDRLAGKPISDYIPRYVTRTIADTLRLRTRKRVDRMSARRGLHLTLDGVHLNGVGADLAAETFAEAIRDKAKIKVER